MTDFYTQLMEKSGFDKALVRHAQSFAKEVDIAEFSRLFFDTEPVEAQKTGVLCFEDAFYPHEFYQKLGGLNLPLEVSSLYVYINLLRQSFEDFSARINDSRIFFDTAKKLTESANEYYKDKGEYGLYDYHFIANHVRGSIIRLSGFEYQYGEYDGKKAIILHVPDYANFDKEKRLDSYKLARQYFGGHPIIADSWLLYGEHKKILPYDSNILSFMDDFDIVSTHETYDYSELFHIFGRLSDYSFDNLPKETSLQKAYAERVKNQLPIGSATGILKY